MKRVKLHNKRARLANVIANGANALIHWQPFNIAPIRCIYNWGNKVRKNDPAWTEFLQAQHSADQQSEQGPGLSEKTA